MIDREKQIAFFDERAVAKMYPIEIAADAGTDGDVLNRFEPANKFVILDYVAHDRLGDGNGRSAILRARRGQCDEECEREWE